MSKNQRKLITYLLKKRTGEVMNWDNPQSLNEKIQWLKLYGDTSMWGPLADKYEVRKYVEKKGLGDILVNLYGRWDTIDEIEWDKLPNSFVLKVNNGSGDVLICKDKSKLNIPEIKKNTPNFLKDMGYYLENRTIAQFILALLLKNCWMLQNNRLKQPL